MELQVAVAQQQTIVDAMTLPLLQLVRNPQSGSHNAATIDALTAILAARGYQVELATSSAREPFVDNPAAAHVCVAGGDGTVRHVAAALSVLPNPPSFSVYPMGTINLVAREWNAPRDPQAFASHVVDEADKRALNIVAINDTHFVACASIGPDSLAVSQVSEALKSKIGRIAYAISLLRVLLSWQEPKIEVQANGETFTCGALYIANGRYYAGPWVVAPKASLGDATVQVAMLKRARRRDFLLFLITTLLGRAFSLANVKIIEARSLSISADRPVSVQLDGDEGAQLPATISVTGSCLRG